MKLHRLEEGIKAAEGELTIGDLVDISNALVQTKVQETVTWQIGKCWVAV